jgi:hypothetical protein
MTRPNQKISERRTLDAVLAALALRLDQEPEEGEAPDFTMFVSGRWIGVEITEFSSCEILEDGTLRRAAESEWERLSAAADTFRRQHPDLGEVNVGLMFKSRVPPWREHAAFLKEVAAFARARLAGLTSRSLEYWPRDFSSPLMQGYLRSVYLRKNRHAEWHVNLSAGFVARTGHRIAAIVTEKSKTRFRPARELWLVIQCGTRISEMMLDIIGVEDFDAVPNLDGWAFSRVFVLAYTGAYEWQKGKGWRQMTGESPVDHGLTSNETKTVLADPELWDDPDKWAHDVAMECVRELREGGDKS